MITIKEEFIRCDKLRRAVKLGGPAVGLVWLALKTYVSEHLTDGFVPVDDVDGLVDGLVDARCRRRCIDALVSCGRLLADGGRGSGLVDRVEHGLRLHDYLEHADDAEYELNRRRLRSERQKKWRRAKQQREIDASNKLGQQPNVDDVDASTVDDVDASPSCARTGAPASPAQPSPAQPSQTELDLDQDPPYGPPVGDAPAKVRPRKSPRSKLPEGWQPNEGHRSLATEVGVELAAEVPKFVDHAAATDRRMADWDAAFRTWLRNAKDFHRGGLLPSGARDSRADAQMRRQLAHIEDLRRQEARERDQAASK